MTPSFRLVDTVPPQEGRASRVVADGEPIAVFRVGGTLYAIAATCTHAEGPLDEGEVTGASVTCPWHGSVFSLRSGEVLEGPATEPVRTYRVRVEGSGLVLERD